MRVTTEQFLTKYKKTISRNVLCIFALLETTLTKIHRVAANAANLYDFFLNVELLTSVTTATLIRPRHPRFPDTYPYPGGTAQFGMTVRNSAIKTCSNDIAEHG